MRTQSSATRVQQLSMALRATLTPHAIAAGPCEYDHQAYRGLPVQKN